VNNSALGANALTALVTYSGCTGVGASTAISADNQVQLGYSTTTTYAYGAVQDRSDIRDKTDIRDTVLGLDFICALRPVDFKWDYREDYKPIMPGPGSTKEEMAVWLEAVKFANLVHDGTHKRSRYHHGIIAQELKVTLDALGIDFGGYQDHSVNGGDDVQSVGLTEMIAPLIAAVKELKARVVALESA
jgi:hypothetical protein